MSVSYESYEFAKKWIYHANNWEKDFEGFSLSFSDFKKSARGLNDSEGISDAELQKAWDKAVKEIQNDPTNWNAQEIPLA